MSAALRNRPRRLHARPEQFCHGLLDDDILFQRVGGLEHHALLVAIREDKMGIGQLLAVADLQTGAAVVVEDGSVQNPAEMRQS